MARPEDRKTFECEILTPAGCQWSGQTIGVIFPATDGLMGVWAGHAPMAALLGAGLLTVEQPAGEPVRRFISGGFVRVEGAKVTVLAEESLEVEAMKAERAQTELTAARGLPASTAVLAQNREAAMDTARKRMQVIRWRDRHAQ